MVKGKTTHLASLEAIKVHSKNDLVHGLKLSGLFLNSGF